MEYEKGGKRTARRIRGSNMTRRRLTASLHHRAGRGHSGVECRSELGRLDHVLDVGHRTGSCRHSASDHRRLHRRDGDRGRARACAGGRPAQPDRHQRRIGRSARRGGDHRSISRSVGPSRESSTRRPRPEQSTCSAPTRSTSRHSPLRASTEPPWPSPPTGGASCCCIAPTCSKLPASRLHRHFDDIVAAAEALHGDEISGITMSTDPTGGFTQQTFEYLALADGCQLIDR